MFDYCSTKSFLAATKSKPAFISRGFTNWKDAIAGFNSHAKSDCHKEAMQADQLPKNTGDVAEELNAAHSVEKANNREMFLRILRNIRFLAPQELDLRGGNDGEDSNLTQLLRLRMFDYPAVADWMEKKTK